MMKIEAFLKITAVGNFWSSSTSWQRKTQWSSGKSELYLDFDGTLV